MFAEHEWSVDLQHERNAFAKRPTVAAINHADAIEKAFRAIRDQGYDEGEFIVVGLKRGAYVRSVVV